MKCANCDSENIDVMATDPEDGPVVIMEIRCRDCGYIDSLDLLKKGVDPVEQYRNKTRNKSFCLL